MVVKCISSRKLSKNSIEFSLSNSEQRDSWLNSGYWTLDADIDFLHYLYNYYIVCVLFSHIYYMTYHMISLDVITVTSCYMTMTMCDTFPHSLLCSKSKIKGKEKKRKRKINNDLAILPSHDTRTYPSTNSTLCP